MTTIKIRKRSILYFAFSSILLFVITCTRGMLLANIYGTVALYISVILIMILLIFNTSNSPRKVKNLILYLWMLLTMSLSMLQGITLGSNRNYILYVCICWYIEITAGFLTFQNKDLEKYFCRLFIILLSLISLSYLITLALGLSIGWKNIRIGSSTFNYTHYPVDIFFPLTVTYGYGNVGGITIYRLMGIARESGIMQMFYIWSFYRIDAYFDKHKVLYKILMAAGVISCFSATGIGIFVFSIALDLLLNNKHKLISWRSLGLIFLLVVGLMIFTGTGTFSFSYRMGSQSYSDRDMAVTYGLNNLATHPFTGVGFLKKSNNELIQTDVCFVAALGQIGIIGAFFYCMIYIISFHYAEDKKSFAISNISFIITSLLAQPIYYSPLIYYFLLMNYDNKTRIREV